MENIDSNRRVTPSIRKAIVALSQYLSDLNSERAKCEEELSYLQNACNVIDKMRRRQQPIIDKMFDPINKLQARENENIQEVEKITTQNEKLRQQIKELEEELSTDITSVESIEKRTNYLERNVSEYQKIFTEIFQPYPLPYPYTIDSYMNWAIANRDKIILDNYHHELCQKLHNCPKDFNNLLFTEKEYIVSLLRKLRCATEDIVKEIRKIDLNLSVDPKKHESEVRNALKRYAVIALSMQNINFYD
ncbi:hypothetical protein TRFO_34167 [Tritrichomonas foetus]|uniref:Uncharacterized protein n=1 Tax=Tritrichomonas foetus TaxID=1144522 RepID=A0A1J4JL48_9EUKA|nr:hypothetical protein TRFO_34167 [Tritrichomonas foetus]|eukprot:OHS99393.1 hypothetical protein TRFO_34167 [Tritrichomonas foetus]